jgi:hypothetical protein
MEIPMRLITLIALVVALAGCQNAQQTSQWLQIGQSTASAAGYGTQANAVGAVSDILTSSSSLATAAMGKAGSYNIPLPDQIQSVDSTLTKLGYGDKLDKMKSQMNQAASEAAASAGPVFKNAIKSMTVTDAAGLMTGGQTSVTDYFRNKTQSDLTAQMNPIVQQKLQATGFNSEYQAFLSIYNTLPIANKPNLDIQSYVVGKTLDGIYGKMGQEEIAIRQNPKKAGSALVSQFLSSSKQGN